MVALDKEALICDMAETYHIYNMEDYNVNFIATLAAGLREDSRIRQKADGMKVSLMTLLVGYILDACNFLVWAQTKDAQKGKNRPKSVVDILTKEKVSDLQSFATAEDFEYKRKAIIERMG